MDGENVCTTCGTPIKLPTQEGQTEEKGSEESSESQESSAE